MIVDVHRAKDIREEKYDASVAFLPGRRIRHICVDPVEVFKDANGCAAMLYSLCAAFSWGGRKDLGVRHRGYWEEYWESPVRTAYGSFMYGGNKNLVRWEYELPRLNIEWPHDALCHKYHAAFPHPFSITDFREGLRRILPDRENPAFDFESCSSYEEEEKVSEKTSFGRQYEQSRL